MNGLRRESDITPYDENNDVVNRPNNWIRDGRARGYYKDFPGATPRRVRPRREAMGKGDTVGLLRPHGDTAGRTRQHEPKTTLRTTTKRQENDSL